LPASALEVFNNTPSRKIWAKEQVFKVRHIAVATLKELVVQRNKQMKVLPK
jgi:hypothetical protein